MRLRRRCYEVLEVAAPGDKLSHAVDITVLAVILLSVAMLVYDSTSWSEEWMRPYDWFGNQAHAVPQELRLTHWLELGIVAFFSFEFILRLWCSVENPRFSPHPIWGRLGFIMTPFALIDILAIAPWYAFNLLGIGAGSGQALRMLRILRLFKASRYSHSLQTIGKVFYSKRGEIASILLVLFIMLIVISTLMHYVEREGQPEAFGSIPAAMWWGVITLTTVGYGDVGPITSEGKFFGALIAILGIGIFALPAGILGAAFVEEMDKEKDRNEPEPIPSDTAEAPAPQTRVAHYCPHCGSDVHCPPG